MTVSVIGDGALTGGLAYEALNDCINLKKKQIIILNDNSMSISENVGSTAKYLLRLHTSNTYNKFKSKAYNVVRGFRIDNTDLAMKFLYKAKNSVKYSAMPTSLKRCGNISEYPKSPVPSRIAAVTAKTLLLLLAMFFIASPKSIF